MTKQIEVKQTEIGKIPEDWEVLTVGDFADIVGGGTPSTKDLNNFGGEIPWITPKDLSNYPFRYIQPTFRTLTIFRNLFLPIAIINEPQ
jgi:type I restriction enzyme S subunit